MAFRISFSVEAFWSWSFRRSFSSEMVKVVVSSAASLISRSLKWCSLRLEKVCFLGRFISSGEGKDGRMGEEVSIRYVVVHFASELVVNHIVFIVTIASSSFSFITHAYVYGGHGLPVMLRW